MVCNGALLPKLCIVSDRKENLGNKMSMVGFEKVKSISGNLGEAMAPHSSTLAWKIPWMEEPGRQQSMGSLRVGHD